MGVVLAAYDPRLDRKVALKLLKHLGSSTEEAQTRLEREAQALAKLDHPNVVSVFDVGVHAGQLFVAMEFVAGETLGEWMKAKQDPRPWRELLPVFIAAGRGLAAAHGAKLVHRDFKPDNVMLGDDGRVRVMDFGLARAELDTGTTAATQAEHAAALPQTSLDSALTKAGAILGTPAYMSPEQFAARKVEAASDQFSFCITLWEALYGERPFAASTIAELLGAVTEGRLRPVPRASSVPSWLHEILCRGLCVEPAARWPSMPALLEALANDPAVRRRRVGLAVGLVGLLAGGTWGVTQLAQRDAQVCTNMEQHLAGIWDDARAAELEAAFAATERSYATATWTRVEAQLEAYTDSWVAARVDACEASQRGEQSGELLDLRMACLDARRVRLEATLDGLAEADDTTLREAVSATSTLPSIERCADNETLSTQHPPPEDPELAERATLLERELAQANALGDLGGYKKSLELATAALPKAESIGHEPLQVEALLTLATAASRTADYELSLRTYERSYGMALELLMVREAAKASRMIVGLLAQSFAKYDEAWVWAHSSEALSRRTSPLSYAGHLNSVGILSDLQGQLERAQGYHEEALAIRSRELGPRDIATAHSHNNLATVMALRGDMDRAQEHFEQAVDIWSETLGAHHPTLANSLSNLGEVAKLQGRYDEALAYVERAHAIRIDQLGPDHPQLAYSLNNLTQLHLIAKAFDKARAYAEDSVRVREAGLGATHPDTAYSLFNLGYVLLAQGELSDARARFQRAVDIQAEHELRSDPAVNALMGLGQTLAAQGEADEAIQRLEQALGYALALDNPPNEIDPLRWSLARALWENEDARPRARELAEAARQGYADKESNDDLHEVEAWLAAHRED